MGRNNSKVKWIRLGFAALLIITAVIASFVWAQADIKAVDVKADGIKENVIILKEEGCKPTIPLKLDVALVKKDITTLKDDVAAIKTEQKTAFKEILRRLPK